MDQFLAAIVTGLSTGSIYAIAALGLVLTNKTSGVFNFAHGTQAAVGAFIMWELWKVHHWPWPVAAAAALVLAGLLGGLMLERMAFGLGDKPTANRVVATVGLLVVLQGLLMIRYGAATIQMPPFLPTRTVHLLGVSISYQQIIVFVLAAAAAAGLGWFFRTARTGVAMHAVVDDPALLSLQAINPAQVRRSAWMIGSCFAAASGALMAPSLGLDATLLTLLVIQAFGAAAIGWFNNLPLTYVGGIAVGVAQELTKFLVSRDVVTRNVNAQILQPLPSNVPFIVLFVVLLVAPRHRLVERGARVVRRERPTRPFPWQVVAATSLVAGVFLVVLPHLDQNRLPVFTTAAAYVVIFVSLHLLVRTSGQVSLAHMAFAAVGAAAFAHAQHAGVPFFGALLFAGLVAVPVGALIAIPAIRLSGLYLAIATFGFGILVQNLFFPTFLMFGGELTQRVNRPSFARGDLAYYYLVLAVAVACCLLVLAVRRGRLGRLLRGLADSPTAVAAHGASVNVVRTLAFCISAFLAGVAGALIGPVTGSATGGTYNYLISVLLIAVLFMAGRRPVLSAFIAAAVYMVGPSYSTGANTQPWTQVIFGGLAIAVAMGVVDALRKRWFETARAHERDRAAPLGASRLLAPAGATNPVATPNTAATP
jgi:branched-subunit amino acid ABC-type transport system permease component